MISFRIVACLLLMQLQGNVAVDIEEFTHREVYIDAGGMSDHPDWVCCTTTGDFPKYGLEINAPEGVSHLPFKSHRHGKGKVGSFNYTIPNLKAGTTYRVNLGFAEIHVPACAEKNRVFDVFIQKEKVLKDFDVFVASGGCQTALVEKFLATSNAKGEILVHFEKGEIEFPMISMIEVLSIPSIVPPSNKIYVVDAGSPSGDKLQLTKGKTGATANSVQISGLNEGEDQKPYQSYRWGDNGGFTYIFDGLKQFSNYHIKLGFAELDTNHCQSGSRVFHIAIQGLAAIKKLDVYDEAQACDKAVIKTFERVSDAKGKLRIDFLIGNNGFPFVSLIEISDASEDATE